MENKKAQSDVKLIDRFLGHAYNVVPVGYQARHAGVTQW